MKCYMLEMLSIREFYGSKLDAHHSAKELPKHQWPEVYIVEVEIATDKESILRALNGDPPITGVRGKQYGLTSRGGLEECEEAAPSAPLDVTQTEG